MVETGSVRLRKQVTTETVNQPVQIRRETLVVDRVAGTGSQETAGTAATAGTAGTFTPFEQGEIVIKLHKEEPVVEKKVIATGRIVAKTTTDTEQVTVSREVRKENIDVEKIGNPQNVTISESVGARPSDAVGGTGTGSQQIKGTETKDKSTNGTQRTPPPAEQK
jgi:stress response protein YsnF